MKILVCGGRDYSDRTRVFQVLDYLHQNRRPITLVIHGAATGADALGKEWAQTRGVEDDPYPARWDWLEAPNAVIKRTKAGKPYNANAGPDRNAKMLSHGKPELVVAFPGGRGTENAIELARNAGVKVIEVVENPAS
jgi:hypothetical protein